MTNRELGATILMLGAECKDLKGEEAKELLSQVESEITNHIKDQLKNGVLHSVVCSCCKSNKATICDKCNSDMCVSASGHN
jgi:hypothetical protein